MKSACVFSIDDAYLMPFQVFFHSLEATESIPSNTNIFILHDHALSDRSIVKLRNFLAGYGRTASFLDSTYLIPDDLPIKAGDHVSPATFYRLFIAEILPEEVDLAVYLDTDMLALQSIAKLFRSRVSALVAAVDHCTPENQIRLWGDQGGGYFQAGVLVIPVNIWRQRKMSDIFLQVMAAERERIQWWDQDILNIAFEDAWQRLPLWYNMCSNVQEVMQTVYTNKAINDNTILIHYSGCFKPWNTYKPSPFTMQWDRAYEDLFGVSFDRKSLLPPLYSRLRAALATRVKGMLYGQGIRAIH